MKLRIKYLSIVLSLLSVLPLTTSVFVPAAHADSSGGNCAAEETALAAAHTATVNAKAAYDTAWSLWRYDQDQVGELNNQFRVMIEMKGPNYTPYGNVYAYTVALNALAKEMRDMQDTTNASHLAMLLARDAWQKAQTAEMNAVIALLQCLGLW